MRGSGLDLSLGSTVNLRVSGAESPSSTARMLVYQHTVCLL
jgi:hypothetical protein